VIRVGRGKAGNLAENLGIAVEPELAVEALQNTESETLALSPRGRPGSGMTRRGAVPGVARHYGGANGDVGACVEEVLGPPVEASCPGHRDSHQPEGGPASFRRCGVRDAQGLIDCAEMVMRVERDEISHEQRVAVGDLADERLDELVVRMEAAGQEQRQEVHTGLAMVRVLRGTGPK
jgi:hypothetical protein